MRLPRPHAQTRVLLQVVAAYCAAACAVFAWRGQGRLAFAGVFLLGLLAIVAFHLYLRRLLMRPVVRLSSLAMTWLPGSSFPSPSPEDAHEVQNLQLALQFLLDRLSKELQKANALAEFKG